MELIYVGALALVGLAFLAVEVWKHLRNERLSRWHSEQPSEKTINVYADSNLARVDAQYCDLRRRFTNIEGALGGDGLPLLSKIRGRIDELEKVFEAFDEQDTRLTYATKRIAELSQELKNKASQEDVTVLNLSVTDAISTLSARIDACSSLEKMRMRKRVEEYLHSGAANPMPDASHNPHKSAIAEMKERIEEYRRDVERSMQATAAQLAAATMSSVSFSTNVADFYTNQSLAGAIEQQRIRFNEVEKRIAELDAEVRECLAHVRSRKTEAVQETAQADATAEAKAEASPAVKLADCGKGAIVGVTYERAIELLDSGAYKRARSALWMNSPWLVRCAGSWFTENGNTVTLGKSLLIDKWIVDGLLVDKVESVQETARAEATAEATIEQRGKTFVEALRALVADPLSKVRRDVWYMDAYLGHRDDIDKASLVVYCDGRIYTLRIHDMLATDWIISR